MNRREAKGKGEKERYTPLNAELQRIAKRGEKAFLSDQCKEIEEDNTMGKTGNLFKKIRDTKGTLHAENYTKKIFMTQIIMICDHSPRARHLECEVKWALELMTTKWR